MLKKEFRLRRARDFALLSQRGFVVFGPYFTLRFRKHGYQTKVGFVASAKIFKTAVARNRVKRRLREAVRLLKEKWPHGYDLLLIAKPEATKAAFQDIQLSLIRSFEKMPLAMERPPKTRPPKAKRKTSVVFKQGVNGSAL